MPCLHRKLFSIPRQHSRKVIDLGDLMPDDKMDQVFVIHYIKQLKGAGFLYIRRSILDICGVYVVISVNFPQLKGELRPDLAGSTDYQYSFHGRFTNLVKIIQYIKVKNDVSHYRTKT